MTPLLMNLIQISLLMSIVAIALNLILNVFPNSIPPKWKYYLWGIILISFLIPFRPRVINPMVTVNAPDMDGTSEGTAVAGNAVSQAADAPSFWSQLDIPFMLFLIWVAGIIVFLTLVFVKHIRFMNTAKRWGTPLSDEKIEKLVGDTMKEMDIKSHIDVIKSKTVTVPMMAGVFEPVLFLPVYALDEEELKYVIRHELIHYRKFDIMVKILSVLANALHWFNPVVYLMQKWIYIDCEIACDYEVTKTYEKDERVKYVETLIGVAKNDIKSKTVFSTNFYGGKKTMKKRLESVFADNKSRNILVVVMVGALLTACIATGAALSIDVAADKDNTVSSDSGATGNTSPPGIGTHDTNGGNTDGAIGTGTPNNGNSDDSTDTGGGSNNANTSADADKDGQKSAGSNSDKDKSPNNIINSKDAGNIALGRTGGGKITENILEDDDGVKVYKIKIINSGYEYEVDVNAKTGKVIEFDREKIDDGDDDD